MRNSVQTMLTMKNNQEKITMLTAYDYQMARICDAAGIDSILVGDSLGMVVLGYEDTTMVTMEDMVHHIKAVARGAKKALIVGDMPFLSYNTGIEAAVANAGRLIQAGANCVKLEGGQEIASVITAIVQAKIPVCAHLGLTPQAIHQLGGYKVNGRDEASAEKLINDCHAVEDAGASMLVLECVPEKLAAKITGQLNIPVIGIGASRVCHGQVLVSSDMLGIYKDFTPKFVKQFVQCGALMKTGIEAYINEVKTSTFPSEEHCFK